jgi:muramoyltetrapeptide carboxypeptidase
MAILKKGDKIGIIAPSVGLNDKDITPTINYFKNIGLTPIFAKNLSKNYRYMAGTDKERADNINKLFKDDSIKALFCLRGGAGATRILDLLDYNLIKQNKKPIFGLSDSTALQNALITKTNTTSYTGFLPLYDLSDDINKTLDASLQKTLFNNHQTIISGNCLKKGECKGKIIGGCLSVLTYLCGTQYFPNLSGKILLLEDIGEKTYKIDLMLNQLKQQKNFNRLKAIIIGQFHNCIISDKEDGTIEDCIKDFTNGLNIPIITNFAYGHIKERYVVPLNKTVTLKSTTKECSISW